MGSDKKLSLCFALGPFISFPGRVWSTQFDSKTKKNSAGQISHDNSNASVPSQCQGNSISICFFFFMVCITSRCSRMCQGSLASTAQCGGSSSLCRGGELCPEGLFLLEQNPEVGLCSQGEIFNLQIMSADQRWPGFLEPHLLGGGSIAQWPRVYVAFWELFKAEEWRKLDS